MARKRTRSAPPPPNVFPREHVTGIAHDGNSQPETEPVRINLDAADLRPLVAAAAELLRRLEDYRRVGAPAQYQANDLLTLQEWGRVSAAVLDVENRLTDLGIGEPCPPVRHASCSARSAKAAQGLCMWLQTKRDNLGGWGRTANGLWGLYTDGRPLPDAGPLISRVTRDVTELGEEPPHVARDKQPSCPTAAHCLLPGGRRIRWDEEVDCAPLLYRLFDHLLTRTDWPAPLRDVGKAVWRQPTLEKTVRNAVGRLDDRLEKIGLSGLFYCAGRLVHKTR